MPSSAASRRRVRPTFAAAVLCGLLGGSLTGLGAFGFDGTPAAAADECYGLGAPPSTGTVAPPTAAAEEPQSTIALAPISAEPAPTPEGGSTDVEPTDPDGETTTDQPAPIGGDVTADAFPDLTTTAPLICPPHGATPITSPAPELPTPEPSPTVDPVEVPPVLTPPVVVPPTPTPEPAPQTPPQPDDDDSELGVPVLGKPTEIGVSGRGMPRSPTPGRTGTISRPEVIARAVSWVIQKVPYSQSRWWTDSAGTFRQDCSGYVSMAWRTDQRINYWTGNLARISDRISSPALRPGDLLNLAGKHVVIFAGWEDAGKTKFRLFEQYATGQTPRFVRNAPLSYYLSRGYGAYRYEGITETAAVRGVTAPKPLSTPVPAPAAASSHHQSIALVAASSDLDPAIAPSNGAEVRPPTPESLLVGLPATTWSPAVAEQYTSDDAVAQTLPAGSTPPATELSSPEQSVAEQRAIDTSQAAQARLPQTARSVEPTSPAGVLLALGLGLLFVAVPLAAAARGRIWAPVVTPFETRPGG